MQYLPISFNNGSTFTKPFRASTEKQLFSRKDSRRCSIVSIDYLKPQMFSIFDDNFSPLGNESINL